MELANMDQRDEQMLLGEGPENQQTNIKWVSRISFHYTFFNLNFGIHLSLIQNIEEINLEQILHADVQIIK